MPLDYATVKDWRFDEVRQRYDEKDAMLYALGIGLARTPRTNASCAMCTSATCWPFPP